MGKWIILLRGVNVSGQKKIIMSQLRQQLENAGFQNVVTYIQSGNIILDSQEAASQKEIEQQIAVLISKEYGFEVDVFAIMPERLKIIIENNPYTDDRVVDNKTLYVTYLDGDPDSKNIEQLRSYNVSPDEYIIGESVIYIRYMNGAGKSKLTNNLLESKLKVKATSRNWNTTLKLLELSL